MSLEVYRFLSSEVKAYLDSFETMTIWHLKDLASGSKRIIRSDNVKVLAIPQFEGLSIENLMAFANRYPEVMQALPPFNEIAKLSRAYIGNVIFSLVGEPFAKWV